MTRMIRSETTLSTRLRGVCLKRLREVSLTAKIHPLWGAGSFKSSSIRLITLAHSLSSKLVYRGDNYVRRHAHFQRGAIGSASHFANSRKSVVRIQPINS